VYRGLGVEIPYPENWVVSDDSQSGGDAVFIESPNTAYISLTRLGNSPELEQAIEEATEIMESEYDEIEMEDLDLEDIGSGLDLGHALVRDLRFFHLNLVVMSRLIAFKHGESTYLMQMQAEDREFQSLSEVFRAVLFGMARSLAPKI
jgi:hypothetical protein